MQTNQDRAYNDDGLKSLLCGLETPFPLTLQEQFHLFSLLDNAVFAIRSGFADLFDIPPAAFPALEALHGKFVRSFQAYGDPDLNTAYFNRLLKGASMPFTYPINLTFSEHNAVLQLVHNVILEAGQGVVDDPEPLPLLQAVYRKYTKVFGGADMSQDLQLDLTFSQHKAVLQLVHNVILEAGQGVVDDPEPLPLLQAVYRKYHKAFGCGTDMFQDF